MRAVSFYIVCSSSCLTSIFHDEPIQRAMFDRYVFLASPPMTTKSKGVDLGVFQIFECAQGELDYEQDVPGKTMARTSVDC
jgi:hypothetical protein